MSQQRWPRKMTRGVLPHIVAEHPDSLAAAWIREQLEVAS